MIVKLKFQICIKSTQRLLCILSWVLCSNMYQIYTRILYSKLRLQIQMSNEIWFHDCKIKISYIYQIYTVNVMYYKLGFVLRYSQGKYHIS